MVLKFISPVGFFVSLVIGLFFVYLSHPSPDIIRVYPTPSNINDIQYNVNDDSTLATEVTPGPIPSKQLLDDIDLIPFIGIENDSSLGSDQRKLNVYYQKISRLLHE